MPRTRIPAFAPLRQPTKINLKALSRNPGGLGRRGEGAKLIYIKAEATARHHQDWMLTTYTVYLRGPSLDQDAFEPVMCRANELMGRVRDILKNNPACETAAVFLGDTELFQLKQPSTRTAS